MMHIEYISKQKAIDELCNVDEYNTRNKIYSTRSKSGTSYHSMN